LKRFGQLVVPGKFEPWRKNGRQEILWTLKSVLGK
jgi:hypothetical protein